MYPNVAKTGRKKKKEFSVVLVGFDFFFFFPTLGICRSVFRIRTYRKDHLERKLLRGPVGGPVF